MNQSITLKSLTFFVAAALLAVPASISAATPKGNPAIPDFTKGDAIPAGAKHDWNLGPTGLRGWMFCDQMVTTDARQISITQVEKGSPADGVFLVGDVILKVGGNPFSYDPRTEFGQAVTAAESEAGGGTLTLTRWRAGKTDEVVVTLPVLGSYGATAPYDCPKSKRILEQGCKALAGKVAKSPHRDDPIVRSLHALALLASGDPAYLPLIKKEAQWAAGYSSDSMQTWHYGNVMMLLEEGIRACVNYTRDQNPWASEHRTPELMKILLSYGAHAKPVIPELTQIANYFENDEKDFPKELMLMKAKCVRETIRAIEAATDTPELINLK